MGAITSFQALISSSITKLLVLCSLVKPPLNSPVRHPSPSFSDVEMQTPPTSQNAPNNFNLEVGAAVVSSQSNNRDADVAKVVLGFSFPAAISLLIFYYQAQPHVPSCL
uniref:Uncharacterized protein n=1 Tax=Nelumbo nucifera TaxID=4432 RepID=A0A822YZA2_NELNU|nr:TPA_asm: hypothetical protein HUJ06_007196 [Nelumbo nucifera]